MLQKINKIRLNFVKDEEGLALTEYLILLGLLTGGVIAAVILVGGELSAAWESWAEWFQGTDLDAPPPGT